MPSQTATVLELAVSKKLEYVVDSLRCSFHPGSLGLVQVWTSTLGKQWTGFSGKEHKNRVVLHTYDQPYYLSNQYLQAVRSKSCKDGITGSALGMLGKVWNSGAVQVVQNINIIPQSVHPRDKLDGNSIKHVAELIYIPIYDLSTLRSGVVAVLEVIVASGSPEAMMVANVISCVSNLLGDLQLSLSKEDLERASLSSLSSTPSSPDSPTALESMAIDAPEAAPRRKMGADPVSTQVLKPRISAPVPSLARTSSIARTSSVRRLNSLTDMLDQISQATPPVNKPSRMSYDGHTAVYAAVLGASARVAT